MQPIFLHSKNEKTKKQKPKITKNMKRKIENPKGQSTQKESKRKSVSEPARLRTQKGGLGKN